MSTTASGSRGWSGWLRVVANVIAGLFLLAVALIVVLVWHLYKGERVESAMRRDPLAVADLEQARAGALRSNAGSNFYFPSPGELDRCWSTKDLASAGRRLRSIADESGWNVVVAASPSTAAPSHDNVDLFTGSKDLAGATTHLTARSESGNAVCIHMRAKI